MSLFRNEFAPFTTKNVRAHRCLTTLVPFLGLAFAACAQPTDEGAPSSEAPIVSNRPQTYTSFTAIVRLASAPLLASARTVNGKLKVDPAAKARLLAEQQRFIDSLATMPGQPRVLYTYRLTLNALAVVAPVELKDKFMSLPGVITIEEQSNFERPEPLFSSSVSGTDDLTGDTSVSFIGASAAQKLGLTGAGMRLGVIDTGIDYTHKMLGGAGTAAAYTSNDPLTIEAGSFPTAKVVGGIDLVGTTYDSGSIDEKNHIPQPDSDPLDEAGHGSHVAGTIAGRGDATNTYDGVAPDAVLYAIKIFGKTGSTGDAPILAAFEYAADPDRDLDPQDRLDAVNLSLGADWGTRFAFYDEAVKNLARAGTVTVCAAGNAGPTPYIVSAPGTSEHAISVAAAVDNSPWNWRFDAALFSYRENANDLQQVFDASFTKPSKEAVGVAGKLAYIGDAAVDLTDAQKAAVTGKVALIDRGGVPFFDKVKRASDAGAIGVVVANNKPGNPIAMGGGGAAGTFAIPALMITQALGATVKADLAAASDVTVSFATGKTIDKPEIVDSLASFSSRGPRSIDGLIKPEVTGPGYQVVSAKMGSGAEGVKFSGTSMATPHITGAVALLRQAHPEADVAELKARLMGSGAPVHDDKGPIGVAAQGAGRVQIVQAAQAVLVVDPPAVSLGVIAASAPVSKSQTVRIKNTGGTAVQAKLSWAVKPGLTVTGPSTVTIQAHATKSVTLGFAVDLSQATDAVTELDNIVRVTTGTGDAAQTVSLPVLAEGRRGSSVKLASFSRTSNGPINLSFSNAGPQAGDVYAFNLLGQEATSSSYGPCALTSAGYRVVTRTNADATTTQLLEIGVRLAQPMSTWNACEVSALIDANNDGIAEQELAGSGEAGLWSTAAPADPFASFLVDAAQMRDIEARTERGDAGTDVLSSAVLDTQSFTRFAFSPVGIIAADLSKIAKTSNGMIRIQLATLPYFTGGVRDDVLGNKRWYVIDPAHAPFQGLPESIAIASGQAAQLSSASFVSNSSLLVYFPQNDPSVPTGLLVPGRGAPRFLP